MGSIEPTVTIPQEQPQTIQAPEQPATPVEVTSDTE